MNEKGEIIDQKKLPGNEEAVDFLKEFGEGMEVAIEATFSICWVFYNGPDITPLPLLRHCRIAVVAVYEVGLTRK